MIAKNHFVKDLQEKDGIKSPFLVKYSAVLIGKTGKPYMNLVLMDKTGEIEARVWDDVASYSGQAVKDVFVQVDAKCQVFQGRKQLVINSMQVLREDQVDHKDFIPESRLNPAALYQQLLGYIESMQDPYYKALAQAVLVEDPEIVDCVQRAPAAKGMHHAYRTGLLEHMVSIAGVLDRLSEHYGEVMDRDLLLIGGFFHDIGKIWELSYDRVTDYTTEGKLIGHLVMGVELIERKVQELNAQSGRLPTPFPEGKKLLAKHMILAHHGKLEYGSPKEPHCLEALVVHYVDDLDSKINAIQMFVEQDQTPGDWTALHRNFNRYFFKG